MQIRPTIPGVLGVEIIGPAYYVAEMIDTLDAVADWEIASEIDRVTGEQTDTATLLLQRSYAVD